MKACCKKYYGDDPNLPYHYHIDDEMVCPVCYKKRRLTKRQANPKRVEYTG